MGEKGHFWCKIPRVHSLFRWHLYLCYLVFFIEQCLQHEFHAPVPRLRLKVASRLSISLRLNLTLRLNLALRLSAALQPNMTLRLTTTLCFNTSMIQLLKFVALIRIIISFCCMVGVEASTTRLGSRKY